MRRKASELADAIGVPDVAKYDLLKRVKGEDDPKADAAAEESDDVNRAK